MTKSAYFLPIFGQKTLKVQVLGTPTERIPQIEETARKAQEEKEQQQALAKLQILNEQSVQTLDDLVENKPVVDSKSTPKKEDPEILISTYMGKISELMDNARNSNLTELDIEAKQSTFQFYKSKLQGIVKTESLNALEKDFNEMIKSKAPLPKKRGFFNFRK